MKRHVTNDSVEVKKERNGEESNAIKKRLKVSHKDVDKPATPNKIPENMEDIHGEINGTSRPMQFSETVTSPPVPAQNRTKADKSLNAASGLSGANGAFAICTAHNISDLSNSNDVPSRINGVCLNEDEIVKSVSDDETMSLPPTGEANEKSSIEDAKEDNIDVEGIQSDVKDCSFKYDIDTFLNSFLEVVQLEGHADEILSVIADGDIILSASADTTIKQWNSKTKTEVVNFQGHTAPVTALTLLTLEQTATISSEMNFADVSRIVISASLDCSVRMWALNSGVELSSFYTYNGIRCLEYLEDTHQVVLGTDGGKLELWNLISPKLVHSVLAHEEEITGLKTEDGYVYTTSTDGKAKVWVLEDNECYAIYTRRRMQHSKESSELEPAQWKCIACHDHLMYLGDNTSNLKILDWRKGNIKLMKNQTQQNGMTNNIIIKENILLSLCYDTISDTSGINVWKLPSMTYACTISGLTVDKLSCLAMTVTDDKVLRIVSGGKNLLVWNFITEKPPLNKINAKYYCREMENLGNEIEERDEPDKPLSPSKKAIIVNEETKSKPSSWSCIVM